MSSEFFNYRCNYSPAASKKAVTVGASTLSDTKAYFSNDGPCVVSDLSASYLTQKKKNLA